MRRTIAILVALGSMALLIAGSVLFPRYSGGLAGRAADYILANAVGPEDNELPPTAYGHPPSYGDIKQIGGQGEGLNCSLPPGVDTYAFPRDAKRIAPVSLKMRQACIAHDYCYRHGDATYGYTQADCDYILQENAFRLCRQVTGVKSVPACETDARKITLGVRIGGAGSFRHAGVASNTGRYSTYFEFDRYPLRATEYSVMRIADTPAAWRGEGMAPKALYMFTSHRTGTRLRIIGLKPGAPAVCALVDLPAEFRWLNTPPLVLRQEANGVDWLVWPRRTSLENTGVAFDGLAPATATRADWDNVFGKVTWYPPEQAQGCTRDPFAASSTVRSAFRNVRVPETQIADFHPPLGVRKGLLDGTRLHLLGLTTYECGAKDDASTCVGHLQIDPLQATASFTAFQTLDPNCLRRHHPRFQEAQSGLRTGDCDRYRGFALAPMVTSRDGTLGMAWLKRGASNGEGYTDQATLRFAPAKEPEQDAKGPKLVNYRDFKLAGLSEEREPVALTSTEGGQQALFAASYDETCKGMLRVTRFPLVEQVDLGGADKVAGRSPDSECRKDLVEDFLTRPFSTIHQSSMIFLRTFQDSVAYLGPDDRRKEAKIDLEVAVLPTSSATAATVVQKIPGVFTIYVCDRAPQFGLAAVPCDTPKRALYGKAQPLSDMPYLAVRAINRTPITVASLMDDEPDIIVVHPIDPMQTVWLKGRKTPDGSSWTFEKQ
jgi:hypothetical protein